ncbi:uncharacterized protein DNG_10161 [Cephalotrichum gorgonifer]|uniref:Uncharacterized protein n=1 Tax=Cephalotrichum gorgonifer TaxID=2041049 RepID=A0AAE8N923_9PEZI|nr:uncharacterized protein DNG_10161 [Cephalotrichum gorgonifer]
MASKITADGRVIAPLNITNPTPSFDLKGFRWGTTDEPKLGPQASKDDHEKDSADQPSIAASSKLVFQQPQGGPPPGRETSPGPTPGPPPQLPHHKQFDDQLGIAGEERPPPLPFPLAQFQGGYAGNGFNIIFRPTPFQTLTSTPDGPNDNHLELNLTTEQLTFGPTLGEIPNRGFGNQNDIILGGLPYLQTIQNVTNILTGKGDKPKSDVPNGIHFEPGVWLTVPPAETFHTTEEQKRGSVVRMASIPHGTTINAQGPIPARNPNTPLGGDPEGPRFHDIDTTPFLINNFTEAGRARGIFHSMDATRNNSTNKLRTPSDLSKFNETKGGSGRITTAIIKNPNIVLQNAIKGQTITETITFEVATGLPDAKYNGGGTANISFLAGKQATITSEAPGRDDMPNAHSPFMSSRFWIETVQYQVTVPRLAPKETILLRPTMPDDSTAPTPQFAITAPAKGVAGVTTVTVPGIQIQYSQMVHLNFGPDPGTMLTWPHVSVATLVPTGPQPFQMQ